MSEIREGIDTSLFKKINSIFFCAILIAGGILFFMVPRQKISEDEKRVITPFPSFSMEKLLSSQYTDSIDLFYSDNFIFRNNLISFSAWIKKRRGYYGSEIQYYAGDQKAEKKPDNSTGVDDAAEEDLPVDMPYENLKSIIIANKRAVQMFGGSKFAAAKYSSLLKQYKSEFADSIRIFCMAIPVGSDYYLPAKLNRKKEKEFIDTLYSYLGNDIICVNAYEELRKHKQEYIQFNTDHHWTGLGAYYAYVSFCRAAGVAPVALQNMTRKVIPGFLGTLYYRTRSEDLKENIDSVVYHKIPFETQATYFKSGFTKPMAGSLYAENAKGGNSYGVYLGSDYPLMRVVSTVKNGRRIVIFKDSYGNAFSPYLASHFEEVFIADYRYFEGNIKELVKMYGITDMIFAHNVYVLNSDFTISREKGFLTGKSESVQKKDDKKKKGNK